MKPGRGVTVQVQRRDSYGTVRIYPVCVRAQAFAQLAGRRTLSPTDLGLIERLGFTVEWVPQDLQQEAASGRE